jgi:hypothetical protein
MPIAAHVPIRVAKRSWITPAGLDRLLLAGADPHTSPALWARARMLRRRRRRARLADGLERAVAASQAPQVPWTTAIPVQTEEVRATRTLMLNLASRIRADDAPPAALILVHRLLTDGNGPLYAPAAPGTLRDAVVKAMLALEDVGPHPR